VIPLASPGLTQGLTRGSREGGARLGEGPRLDPVIMAGLVPAV